MNEWGCLHQIGGCSLDQMRYRGGSKRSPHRIPRRSHSNPQRREKNLITFLSMVRCTSLTLENGARFCGNHPQWCNCTFFFSFNGAAAPFSRSRMVPAPVEISPPYLEWCGCTFFSPWILTLLWRLSSPLSSFFHFPKNNSDPSLYLSQKPSSFIHQPMYLPPFFPKKNYNPSLYLLPENHPHSSIIYILLSCPVSTLPKLVWSLFMSIFCTFPLTPPTWKKPLTSPERAKKHPHATESPSQKYSPSLRTSSRSTFPRFLMPNKKIK